jgi:hypothetical protein
MLQHLSKLRDLDLGFGATLLALIFGSAAAYVISIVIYRLYFHPFSKYPGPTVAAITRWYRFYHNVIRDGKLLSEIEKYHKKYGDYPYSKRVLTCFVPE